MIAVFFTNGRRKRPEISVRVAGEVRTDFELWQSDEDPDHSLIYFPNLTPAEAMHVEIAYVPELWTA